MSDEIRNPDTNDTLQETADEALNTATNSGEEALNTATNSGEEVLNTATNSGEEALNEELNDLKDLFQQEWNKATAEAESPAMPEIQALDDTPDPEDADDSEEEEERTALNGETAVETKKKKKEKKDKKHSKAPLVIIIVLLVLLLIPLSLYVVISVKAPTFPNFISAYAKAISAKEYDERIAGYESALSYCEEGSGLEKMKQSIYEEIVLLKCETEGYESAYTYMKDNMTEDMLQNTKSKEFAEFLAAGKAVDAIADGAYDAVKEAVSSAGSAENADYDAVMKSLNTPDVLTATVGDILKTLAEGVEAEKDGLGEDNLNNVMTGYLSAYNSFKAIGADAQKLLEIAIAKLFNAGYISETNTLITNYFTDEMLANIRTEEFKTVQTRMETLKNIDADVFSVAKALFENNTVSDDDIKDALGLTIPDTDAAVIIGIARNVIDALQAEKDKRLTTAAASLVKALQSLSSLGLSVNDVSEKLIMLYLQTGNDQNAGEVRQTYITDEALANGSDELKAAVQMLDDLSAGQTAAAEVVSSYFTNHIYHGAELDKEAVNAALDSLTATNDAPYVSAFAAYFKYLAEEYTDADPETLRGYITEFSKYFRDYPAFYDMLIADTYKMQGNYAQARTLAEQVLEINADDDDANAMVAFTLRASGKLDEALAAAEKGVEMSGTVNRSGYEATVCYMLKGDFASAFNYAKKLYDDNLASGTLTKDHCEAVLLIAALYETDDAAVQAELESYQTQVEDLYANNDVTADEKVQKVIDGKLTLEDLFMKEPYTVR